MKMKKIACGTLAAATALSMTVPAFAAVKPLAETSESSFEIALEGMIYTPVIRVQVTESGNVYVNPSKGAIAGTMTKALDGTGNLDYSFSGMGVASTPILIRSDTDKALDVKATATATVPKTSGATIVDGSIASTVTDKNISLFVTGNSTALGDASALASTPADPDAGTPAVAGLTEDDVDTTAPTGAKIVAGENGKSGSIAAAVKVATIGAAAQTVVSGKLTEVVPQYGVVMVSGASAAKAAWTENDVVNVTVALTFDIATD